MELKYTRHFLNKLEELFAESDYMLRYEKGNFKAGFCVLKDMKVVVVNKYYALEGSVSSGASSTTNDATASALAMQ